MKYKNKHFYTALQHIDYMLNVEGLNQVDVNVVLREYWKLNNNDIMYVMEYYEINSNANTDSIMLNETKQGDK